MTYYLEILAVQDPAPIGVDGNNRTIFSCNFDVYAEGPVSNLEREVASILSAAGFATLNVDTFIGPATILPTGAGPYTTIIKTGGVSPRETHNGTRYERPSFQVLTRAKDYSLASTRALATYRALDGVRNTTVTAA